MTVIDSAKHSDTASLSDALPLDPAELQDLLDRIIDDLSTAMQTEMRRIALTVVEEVVPGLTAAAPPSAAWSEFVDEQVGPMLTTLYKGAALSTTLAAIPPPHIAELMAPVINQAAVDYAAVATNRIVGAGSQLWGQVRTELGDTLASGGTVEDLKSTVERLSGYSEFRADTIARTEVMGAYNHGDNDTAVALAEYGPIEKEWLAAVDMRTRETHIEANGQVVPFNDDFIVGGVPMPFPGQGPPEEVINCRCVVLHYYPGDERSDGTIAGEEQPQAPSADDAQVIDFIQGQLSANPDMTTQQLLDAYKAQGGSVARQRFYGLAREAKGGNRVLPVDPAKVAARQARKAVAEVGDLGAAEWSPAARQRLASNQARARLIANPPSEMPLPKLSARDRSHGRDVFHVNDQGRELNRALINVGDEVQARASTFTDVTREDIERLKLEARSARENIWNAHGRPPWMNEEERHAWREAKKLAADEADKTYNAARAEYENAQRRALAEIRDMGNGQVKTKGYGTPHFKSAAKEYPTEWIDGLAPHETVKRERGYYDYYGKKIALSGGTPENLRSTAVHELGHAMERTRPGMQQAEHSFFWERAERAGFDSKWSRTSSEWGFKDEWYDQYAGRVYSEATPYSDYEVLTMGMEQMFGGWNGRRSLAQLDPDYERWILGVLATL